MVYCYSEAAFAWDRVLQLSPEHHVISSDTIAVFRKC